MEIDHPLRVWRAANSLSQEQAGARIGVDEMTISRWERRDTEPQKRHWPKIEETTGMSRAQFLGFAEAAE